LARTKKKSTGEEVAGRSGTRGSSRPSGRKAILVLGAHRSGTSALTRVLNLCGASLPEHLMGATDINPRGFFESQPIYHLHERILSDLGSSWKDLAPLPPAWLESELARNYVREMAALVAEEFGDAPLLVLKDPRISRLVPFWLEVLEELVVEPAFVLPIRNPLEMADSLNRAESIDRQRGLLIWLNSVLHAEYGSRKFPRSIVGYDALVDDWRTVLGKISADLDLAFPRLSRRAEAEIDQFITAELRHHEVSADELAVRGDVLDWVKMTYEWLCLSAAGKKLPTGKIDRLRVAFTEAEKAFGPVLAQAELAREQSDGAADQLRTEVSELSARKDQLEGQIVPLSDESELLRTRLESREEQVGELINCIKLMLVWIASRAPGSKTSSEELQILLQAMDTSDSDSIAETAMEGLRRYQDSVDSSAVARGSLGRRTGPQDSFPAPFHGIDVPASSDEERAREELSVLKSKKEELELSAEKQEDQIRLLGDQLQDKKRILQQALGELAQKESNHEQALGELAQSETRLRLRESEIDSIRARAEELSEDRARIERELSEREQELNALKASRSWRLTRPIRAFGQWTRRMGLGGSTRP